MNTGCTVHEAAVKAGFPDQSYFTRVFKKAFNKAPGEIRKQ
jgi:AraC-like DNA-binding protein